MVGTSLSIAPTIVLVSFSFWTWLLGGSGALLSVFLTILTICFVSLYALFCVACPIYYLTKARADFNVLLHIVLKFGMAAVVVTADDATAGSFASALGR